ncbi:MAG: class I SAM-dependent methyltransferase [Caldilineaceae bacterium]|nr:class I SAM-dependent methyltransferase [Caldilineaceae bacterium]
MNHQDHVRLLSKGIAQPGGVWADLGAGDGAFTLALAELIGETGTIYAVDRNQSALRHLARAMQERFPQVALHSLVGDFDRPLELPALDGIVMTNSLHFIRNKEGTLAHIRSYLKPEGRLLMVEYNSDQGNPWVPYPFSYATWAQLSRESGFQHTELLATHPSRFLREIYSAVSWSDS